MPDSSSPTPVRSDTALGKVAIYRADPDATLKPAVRHSAEVEADLAVVTFSKTRPMSPTNPVTRYLHSSWAQTCGVGWSPKQITFSYATSIALTSVVLVAAYANGLSWSWAQYVVAAFLAWDLLLGVIGYSHPAIKRRRDRESSNLPVWHHNLQHIHPLILIYFDQPSLLLAIGAYWFVTFLLYVEFLEVVPATGRRRLGVTAQKWVVGLEAAVSLGLVSMSFVVADVTASFQAFGVTVYGGLIVATAVLTRAPVDFQRTIAVVAVVTMTVVGLFLSPPAGFEWLVPVYFLKLLAGFTAREPLQGTDSQAL